MPCDDLSLEPGLHKVLDEITAQGLFDWEGLSVVEVRAKLAAVKTRVTSPHVDQIQDLSIPSEEGNAIPCRFYHPCPGTSLPLLVWLHGGGWVLGGLDGEEATARQLATIGQIAVLSVDYRLAPEHRFPSAFLDARSAFQWAFDHVAELDGSTVAIGGASAGGNLAAAVSLDLALCNQALPTHQFLVYPITDCGVDEPSMKTYADGPVLTRGDMIWFWDQYVPDHTQRTDPRVAVARSHIPESLPPATVLLAQHDPLIDQGLAYARQLEEAGIRTSCTTVQGMTHGFVGLASKVRSARTAFHGAIDRLSRELHEG